jgi:hypothetical protein
MFFQQLREREQQLADAQGQHVEVGTIPPGMPWACGPAWDKLDSFPDQPRTLLEFMRWRASATKDEVYRAVWGGLSAIGHDERIRQAVCRVNRRLKTSGHGYRLAGGSKSSKVVRWKLVGS